MTTITEIVVPTYEHQPAGWEAWDCDCGGTGRMRYGPRWTEPCPSCAAGYQKCEGPGCPNPATHRALRCRTLYCDTCYQGD